MSVNNVILMIFLGLAIAFAIAMSILLMTSTSHDNQKLPELPKNMVNVSYQHEISFDPNEKVLYYSYVSLSYYAFNNSNYSYTTFNNYSPAAFLLYFNGSLNPNYFNVFPKMIIIKNISEPIVLKIVVYNSSFNVTLPYNSQYFVISSIQEQISTNSATIYVTINLKNVKPNSTLILPLICNGEKANIIIYVE